MGTFAKANAGLMFQNLVSESIATTYEQLRGEVEKQLQLFVDASSTKEKRIQSWLSMAIAPMFAVLGIFGNRSRTSLLSLAGDYSGVILNCDRAKMYLDGKRLQRCWAYLNRDIQKLIDSPKGRVKRLGRDPVQQQALLYEQSQRHKVGEAKWRGCQRLAGPIRDQFNGCLVRGNCSGNKQLYRPFAVARRWFTKSHRNQLGFTQTIQKRLSRKCFALAF